MKIVILKSYALHIHISLSLYLSIYLSIIYLSKIRSHSDDKTFSFLTLRFLVFEGGYFLHFNVNHNFTLVFKNFKS